MSEGLREHKERLKMQIVRAMRASTSRERFFQSVYFIQARTYSLVHGVERTDAIHIKIGVSLDAAARMRGMRTASHAELKLLGETPNFYQAELVEGVLHAAFAAQRIQGEWFCPSLELYAAIHDLCKVGDIWKDLVPPQSFAIWSRITRGAAA